MMIFDYGKNMCLVCYIDNYNNKCVNCDIFPKWLGAKSNKDEKFEAVKYTQVLKVLN